METRVNKRSDIALTLDIALSIVERYRTGLPLMKRSNNVLLLEGTKWENKIPVGTYNSWRTRNTIPIDSIDNTGFREVLIRERKKIDDEICKNLLRLGERGIEKILKMSLNQKSIEKRINKDGVVQSIIIKESINPVVLSAQMKAITFAMERLSGSYGRGRNAVKEMKPFSLAELRTNK